jgi:rhodanese-related sulfurtransferase
MFLGISITETQQLLDSGVRLRLIDVREPDEFAICKLDGAELLPLSTFAEQFAARLPEFDERILVYCHHGMRSMRAAEYLAKRGYTHVSSIEGGIDAWSQDIDPSVPRY